MNYIFMMFKKQKFHQLSLFRDKSVKGPLGRVGGGERRRPEGGERRAAGDTYKEKKEEGAKIMKIKLSKVMGNLMLPICSLVFTIIFWALGLNHAYSSADVQDSNMSDCLTIDLA